MKNENSVSRKMLSKQSYNYQIHDAGEQVNGYLELAENVAVRQTPRISHRRKEKMRTGYGSGENPVPTELR